MVVKLVQENDRKMLVQGLDGTCEEICHGIVHANVRDKGILVSKWGYGDFYSYLIEFFECESDEDGSIYLRDRDSDKWELVYDNTLHIFFPYCGLSEEKGRNIRFKSEYPPFDRSVSLGKHVIMLALFEEGLNVLIALGRKGRKGMIRRVDRDIQNNDPENLELHIFENYRVRRDLSWDLFEFWIS